MRNRAAGSGIYVPMNANTDPRAKAVPASWATEIDRWCSTLRASGLSRETVYLRRAQISQLARAMESGPLEVEVDDILVWLGGRDWTRETRRTHRSGYRRFFTFLGRVELAEALPRVKPTGPRPRPIPEDLLQAGLRVADDRTRLMLRLAAEVGLRRGEISRVHAADLSRGRDGWTILVHGKGDRERELPLSDGLAAAIRLRAGGDWLFPGDYLGTGHVSPAWVGKLTSRALPEGWTLHKLRHRFATVVHEHTHDLVVVQTLLGHASLATTQLYVAANRDRLRAGALSAAA